MQTALFQKKIFFYTDTPIYGGAERHMLELARHLDRDKYQVTLVCSGYKQLNPWCKQWTERGFNVHRLKVAHKHDPRHLTQLKKILKKEKPQILHLHLWNPGGCRYAFRAVNKKQTKLIATEHDPFPLKGLKNRIKKNCLKKTDLTIAVSNANHDMLVKNYPELKGKIVTIHNGIDIKNFQNNIIRFSSQHKKQVKEKLFKADLNDFIILSVAALHERKGLKYLIEAYAKVREKNPKSKLVIVGEGPERKKLEKLIKNLKLDNDVLLTGERKNVAQILKSGDLFLLPSIKEAFGLVLVEAMAIGLPVVGTNAGGIPEIIENNKSGKIVEAGNSGQLADTIIELMENEPLRQKLAYVGHHEVKKFDVAEMVKKTEKIYDNIT